MYPTASPSTVLFPLLISLNASFPAQDYHLFCNSSVMKCSYTVSVLLTWFGLQDNFHRLFRNRNDILIKTIELLEFGNDVLHIGTLAYSDVQHAATSST